MKLRIASFFFHLLLLCALCFASSAADVVISEFMARNDSILADEDGQFPDWIELHNTGLQTVNLEGWYLTDTTNNLTRWRLPAVNLAANAYLVIFASGKDRTNPATALHTSFQLNGDGEYLGLIEPDGVTVASEYRPGFPPQENDISYGLGSETSVTTLLAAGASARVLVPADDTLGASWTQSGFDDSAWTAGATGVGFSSGATPGSGGLLGYWPLREGSGTVAGNLVASGAPGTIFGATWVNDPERGTVLNFNGSGNYVAAGTIPRLGRTTSNFTWSFWFKQTAVNNGNAVVLGNRSGGVQSPLQFIKFTPSNFEYYRGGNIGFIPYSIPTGQWLHLAVVKNGAALTYYANGTVVGTSTAGGDIEANPFYFGGDPGASGEWANGLLDDISIWNTALTAAQIGQLRTGVAPTSLFGYGHLVSTDVEAAMLNHNASVYVRVPFTVNEEDTFNSLTLRMQYDDGFVAYLNGQEIARRNAPVAPAWNSAATAEHPNEEAVVFEAIDVSAALPAVVDGMNVLAIHGLNAAANDDDFLVRPELEGAFVQGTGLRYFGLPTPGAVNNLGFIDFVADTKFSHDRGFYDTNLAVTITTATPGAVIRYTTNGVAPTETSGLIYSAPIPITNTTVLLAAAFKPGWHPTDVDAQSYLFLDQVLKQTGAGLPTFAWEGGRTPDYAMDQRVVTHPDYAPRIKEDMKSLPVVSIAIDPDEFWGANGIYTKSQKRGIDSERPCSAEMFFPDGSRNGFQINCGIRPVGGASRGGLTPKHGVRLLFKGIYGDTKLRYKFFENSEVDRFDAIQFRPNFNMSWVRTDNSGPLLNNNSDGAERTHAIYVRDQFTKDSQLAMGSPSAHERFVHLYVNGVYWGVYNPSERTDASFAANYLGGDKEEYEAIFSEPSSFKAVDGTDTAWRQALNVANAGLTTPAQYAAIQHYIDVTNLADYMMLNFYCATVDWPWQNWNAARHTNGVFKFLVWDAEYTLDIPPWMPNDRTPNVGNSTGGKPNGNDRNSPARFYYHLKQNAEWRLLFADRVQKHFFNNGALTTNQTIPRFLSLCDQVDRAMVCESARWGDVVRTSQPYTHADWLVEKQRLLTQFFSNRTDLVIGHFKAAGLYPNLPAPELTPRGAAFTNQMALAITASAGTIYYTTNGSDPRLAGGAVSPDAQVYSAPILLTASRRVRARVRQGSTWSALEEANYLEATPIPLRVTEIMYHPQALPAGFTNATDDFEYVELKNIGPTTLNLAGMRFTDGIQFTFGARALPAGETVLVVKNQAAFNQYYGDKFGGGIQPPAIAGEYQGTLSDNGERLRLEGALGEVIQDFSYSDWYPLTDGLGFALVIVDELAPRDTWSRRESWRVGFSPSPDIVDSIPDIPPVLVNEVLTHTDLPVLDAIELHNPGSNGVNVGGWFLTDAADTPVKFVIPANTIIPAGGYLVFDEDDFNPQPGVDPSFSLNSSGDEVYLYSGDGAHPTGYSHGFAFGAAVNGVTFGRYLNSAGEEQFPAQISPTLGAPNAGPRVGPVVINEIHYHALAPEDEFVELKNLTDVAVSLFDLAVPTNTWKIAGLGFAFPPNVQLAPQGLIVLVQSNANAFRAKYQVPAEVPVFEFSGVLQNDGENLELQRPDVPAGNRIPHIVVDAVRYDDRPPWPEAADGFGASLQRLSASQYGNDPVNWKAAPPTPGRETVAGALPQITVQPTDQTIPEFASATFSVEATGAGPLNYLWRLNGNAILDATNATLVLASAELPDQGLYSVVVSGAGGAVISANARLTLLRVPRITLPPEDASVSPGASVTFTVVATGTGTLTYQWFREGQPVPGATASAYTVTNAQLFLNDGVYAVAVSDSVGTRVSEPAVLTVLVAPEITMQPSPAAQTVLEGRTFTITISAEGTLPISFRWRHVVAPFTNINMTVYSTNATLVVENAKPGVHDGGWDVAITNEVGRVLRPSDRAVVTIVSAAPFFALQPTNRLVSAGEEVILMSEARGTDPISYQWYFNGTNLLADATNASLTLSNIQSAAAGAYTVVAANSLGMATSAVAQLTVAAAPVLVSQPTDQSGTPCDELTFAVSAQGVGPLSYQWFFNATTPLANATGPNWTLVHPRPSDAGEYTVVVTNDGGAVTSQVARLTLVLGDCDGDGMSDIWELEHGLDPADPGDRDLDPDHDGRTNWEESLSGTDPHSATSVLKVTLADGGNGGALIRFTAQPDISYAVQYRNQVAAGPWLTLTNLPAQSSSISVEIRDAAAGAAGSRFYRLLTPSQP